MADMPVPMSGNIQIVTAIGTIITGIGAIVTPVLILWIKGQHQIKQEEIALEVDRVRLAAIKAAAKVAKRVETVRQETERTTNRVEEVKKVLDVSADVSARKLDELGRISSESLDVATRALKVGNGAMTRALQRNAELARWRAESKPDSEEFRREADLAERELHEHEADQTRADRT